MQFKKGTQGNDIVYPLTQEQLDNMEPCRLVNPCVGENFGYKIPDSFDVMESYKEVLKVRLDVLNGKFPHWFMEKYYPFKDFDYKPRLPEPLVREGLSLFDTVGLANVVHMDLPSQMPNACLRYLLSEGNNVKAWTSDRINFLETVPFVQEQIGDGIKRSLIKAFKMKYYFGVPRPEEVFESELDLNGISLTAYSDGCPNHPSFPAGHASAAVGGITSLLKEFNELDYQTLHTILDAAYFWAMFRTFAGVHYAEDNILGLMANGFQKYMEKDIVKKYKA